MSAQSGGQSTRTSTSSHPSASSSKSDDDSNSNGRRHSALLNVNVAAANPSLHLGEGVVAPNGSLLTRHEGHEDSHYRLHKPRSSGGFLLQSKPYVTALERSSIPPEANISDNVRGKRRVDNGGISLPKRSSGRQRHRQRQSLGSSPLATKVENVPSTDEIPQNGFPETTRPDSRRSPESQIAQSNLASNRISTGTMPTEDDYNKRSAFGVDTDPAHIVNLALNLSESRRRHVSGGSLLVPRDNYGSRRASPGQLPLGIYNTAGGGSMRQAMNQQRQSSRNTSPRSGRSNRMKGTRSASSQHSKHQNQRSIPVSDLEIGMSDDAVLDASDATLARAEKARVAIELSYEYRRLLQHLPKLPPTSSARTGAGKGAFKPEKFPSEGLGRVYNPLQYIRNRKVRFRLKKPLDTEGDGWNNIENVRAWVDTVVDARTDGILHIDRRYPLPPFERSEEGPPHLDDLQAQNKGHVIEPQVKKISRPRMDWIVGPWDLLADAYWLYLDDNMKHIEDRQGIKFVLENLMQGQDQPRTSKESTRASPRQNQSLIRHINSSPERLRASFESLRSNSKERIKVQYGEREPKSPISDDDGSIKRKRRWRKQFTRSRAPSSSGESDQSKRTKHRRGCDHFGTRDDFDQAALEKQMKERMVKEAEESAGIPEVLSSNGKPSKKSESSPSKADQVVADSNPSPPSKGRPIGPQRTTTDFPEQARHEAPLRSSLDEQRLHQRISSNDFDSTATNSPTTSGFIPSIAINLSPSEKPQTTSISPRKTIPARLVPFRHSRSRSVTNRRAVSENDTDIELTSASNISRQNTAGQPNARNKGQKEQAFDFQNGMLSLTKINNTLSQSRSLESKHIRSVKDTDGSDSRLRGLFKGGRIAELVGNEVSRLGGMIWKKDFSESVSQDDLPRSDYTSEESDFDDGNVNGMGSSSKDNLSRVSTNAAGTGSLSRLSTNSDGPRYYMSNLPTFRSPFGRHEQSAETAELSPGQDHITRQQQLQREQVRSSRFDRLAPPKIDMQRVSPSPSRATSPDKSQVQKLPNEDSRRSSSSRSESVGLRNADRRLNAVLGIPGRVEAPAPTGLSALAPQMSGSKQRPSAEGQWSISDRGMATAQGTVSRRDIARVRALLLSSGVKANEVIRRAEELPQKPSSFLQELHGFFSGSIPQATRLQEHVVAARAMIANIDTTYEQLQKSADELSQAIVDKFHQDIRAIDDRHNHGLTPQVRGAADDADTFSTELTTTHTLAVKQLNDSIDAILRRRRRRLRWIRRGGWAMLEWMLLGMMWMIWFLVMIVRVIRGTVRFFVAALRWFFWL
ncbi:hypothetical protein MMC21_004193 [Puttea exsequens]|nr:hypothetical protein [Puttea exsequens]